MSDVGKQRKSVIITLTDRHSTYKNAFPGHFSGLIGPRDTTTSMCNLIFFWLALLSNLPGLDIEGERRNVNRNNWSMPDLEKLLVQQQEPTKISP